MPLEERAVQVLRSLQAEVAARAEGPDTRFGTFPEEAYNREESSGARPEARVAEGEAGGPR